MIHIDRRYIRYFDWFSFFLMLTLVGIGLLFVYSATYQPHAPHTVFVKKQAFGIATGLLLYLVFCLADYRSLMRVGYFLFFGVIALLMFTLVKGTIGLGAQRWINVYIFKFQPSELAKLFLPSFVTYYLYTEDILKFSLKQFAPLLVILGFSCALILKQPDLGTALLVFFSGMSLMWLAGMNNRVFMIGALVLLITAPLSWRMLKPYQKKRIAVFLGAGDARKERYQIEQSKIAIGSGGMLGKGLLCGTQNTLQFLPESRTDFIFSVLCEEWGLIGALGLLALYLLLFARLFVIIASIKQPFAQLLATGLVLHLLFSTIINIGMVIGLLPIVGIPLPFMSYGISHLWISFASLGWVNGIAMRRFYVGD